VKEVEWKRREAYNDAVATSWEVEAPDGWGNASLVSPIVESWPGIQPNKCGGSFPCLSDVVPLRPNGWPDLSPHSSDGVQVTVEVRLVIEELEGYSACRLLVLLCLPFSP
jgi:hypothetical protein